MNIIIIIIILILIIVINYYTISPLEPGKNLLNNLYNKFIYKFEKVNNYTNLNVDCVYCIVMPQRKEYIKKLFESMKINYVFLFYIRK